MTRSLAFLVAVYAALQAYLWLVVPTKQTWAIAAGAVVFAAVAVFDPWRRKETLASVGLRPTDPKGSFRRIGIPTLALLAALVVANRLIPDAPTSEQFPRRLIQYLPWAFAQHGLLQPTFNKRLAAAWGPGTWSVLGTALLFSLMHLPNPAVTAATFVLGLWWAWAYQRGPDLFALAISHGLLSATAHSLIPAEWTGGFRVGPGYWR